MFVNKKENPYFSGLDVFIQCLVAQYCLCVCQRLSKLHPSVNCQSGNIKLGEGERHTITEIYYSFMA